MRCDAIRATIRGESIFRDGGEQSYFGVSMEDLKCKLGGEWVRTKKGRNGYRLSYQLERENEVICSAFSNGSGDAEGTHQFEAQGHHSVEVKNALDAVFTCTGYATARRDTCFDLLDEPGYPIFHSLADLGRSMAAKKRMTYDQVGQGWICPGETMTVYLGSRNSPVMIRIYLRGLKTIKEGGDDDPLRIRVEVEVKPGKREGKKALSMLSDESLFGCSGWAKDFMEQAGVMGLERHKVGTVWKPSDKQRVVHHLMRQYGGLLRQLLEEKGADGLAALILSSRDEIQEGAKKTAKKIVLEQSVEEW
uniref:Uncharacterized protein n=1 Tax=uncultured prokaryote TaxID=198431 RepID=A0A0H5QL18_9ZZZZ|nr:hypothetical protein [uncultured prokaryote]